MVTRTKQGGGGTDSFLANVARPNRQRLADQIISELQAAITKGELAVGDKLPPEPVLMERFGVGRSTVREAVRALVHSGVLRVQVGDGTYVSGTPAAVDTLTDKVRRAGVAELFDVRRAFEMSVASLAAQNRTEKDLQRMRAAAQACETAAENDDPEAFVEADYRFHIQVAAATKNELLVDLYSELRAAVRATLREQPDVTDVISHHALTLHTKLIKALAEKNSRAAERIWAAAPNPYSSSAR